jgi:23S rRNA (uridine2552-2'-O)-methyltransferase
MYDRKDALYRRAKAEGYRSRAAYKLLELQKRARVLRKGDLVLDLGAWPGGWLQVAAEIVGERGRVVGVDVAAIDPLAIPQVVAMQGDVADPDLPARMIATLGQPADVILCDLAPKLTGIGPRDLARSAELREHAVRVAGATVRPGGTLVMKTFGGGDAAALRDTLRHSFGNVRLVGLAATRKGSSEVYLVATGFRPERLPKSPG